MDCTLTVTQWRRHFEEEVPIEDPTSDSAARMELRRLRQENQQLKEIVADKELEIRIKDPLLKNDVSRVDRMMTAHEFIGTGVPTSVVLRLVGVSKSAVYYRPKEGRRGRTPSTGSRH